MMGRLEEEEEEENESRLHLAIGKATTKITLNDFFNADSRTNFLK